MPDITEFIKSLMGQPTPEPELHPNYKEMYSYIQRTPGLREQYDPIANLREFKASTPEYSRIRSGQILNEAAATADPFGFIQLQRLFGGAPSDQVRLNESHGLANQNYFKFLKGK